MAITPFNASVTIVTKGTAVQLSAVPQLMRHFHVIAYDDNVSDVYIGIGSGTSTTRGNFFKRLRPGDEREFMASHLDVYYDVSDLWINNDASTGSNGDGVVVTKVSKE